MTLRSVKIPIGFLITGIIWALFSDPLITFFTGDMDRMIRDMIRSINDFCFVGAITVILYFQIKKQQQQLYSSEEQYRTLFERNPNPMWIYRSGTLDFVKVNHAAIELYGYSMEEFLSMTVKDIRPDEEKKKLLDCINAIKPGLSNQGTWTHKTKTGELIYASIDTYDLQFNGYPCRLTVASNITGMILKEEKIKAQNAALHEIAWLNSHEVRKSLCSVISLTALLKETNNEQERREYMDMLQQCTNELDGVLLKTNNRVDELKSTDPVITYPVD